MDAAIAPPAVADSCADPRSIDPLPGLEGTRRFHIDIGETLGLGDAYPPPCAVRATAGIDAVLALAVARPSRVTFRMEGAVAVAWLRAGSCTAGELLGCGEVGSVSATLEEPTTLYLFLEPIASGLNRVWITLTSEALPPWYSTAGPPGGAMTAVAVTPPNRIYAATESSGLFLSDDRATTWRRAGDFPPTWGAECVVIDPTDPETAYAGSSQRGISFSRDSGEHWQTPNRGTGGVHSLAFDPTVLGKGYAGGFGSVFRTTTIGRVWDSASALSGEVVDALAVVPTLTSTIYAGTDGGSILRSTNGGANWLLRAAVPSAVRALVVDRARPRTVYAGLAVGGVLRSEDGGLEWSAFGLDDRSVDTLIWGPGPAPALYATSTDGGVFRAGQSSAGWTSIGLEGRPVGGLAFGATANELYAATQDDGVMVSRDAGGRWRAANDGLVVSDIRALAFSGERSTEAFAATSSGRVFHLGPDGSWQPVAGLQDVVSLHAAAPGTGSRLYAVASDGVIHRSSDWGERWVPIDPHFRQEVIRHVALSPTDGQLLFAATDAARIYRSEDGGGRWDFAGAGLPANAASALVVDASGVVSAAIDNFIYRSDNGGRRWGAVTDRLVASAITSLTVYEGRSFVGTAGSGVFRTAGDGTQWASANAGITQSTVLGIAYDGGMSTLYAALQSAGLAVSDDHGASWIQYATLPPVAKVEVSPWTAGVALAGSVGAGVLKTATGGR